MPDKLEEAIAVVKAGNKEKGRDLLEQFLQNQPDNEKAWLWLSSIAVSTEERRRCLEQILALDPNHLWAKRGLAALERRSRLQDSGQGSKVPTTSELLLNASRPANGAAQTEGPTIRLDQAREPVRPGQKPATASGAYDVFISYSRKNKSFVQKLYEALLADEREVWVDWGNIPLMADWRREIREGIERSNAVLFVMSPEFLASEECRAELRQAEAFNKRLIPLVYQDVSPKDTPPSLAALNWLFFRQADDFEASFQSLLKTIDTDLEWVKAHTRLLVRATEWEVAHRNHSFVLQGDDLREAELSVAQADKNPSPTPLQKQYLLASRHEATRRQSLMLARITFGLVISIILALVAFWQFSRANAAQLVATTKRDQALSRQLGVLAILYADDQPDRAALLSLEAGRIVKGMTGELLVNLRHSPYLITILHEHTNNLHTVAFNPAGTIFASGGKDQTIILWDVATYKPLGPPLTGHTDRVMQVAFSPDGKLLASASRDKTIRLWDVATRQPLGEPLTGHTDRVNSVAFSPDGQFIISGSSDTTIIFWDVATRRPLGEPLTGHTGPINSVVVSPDGKILASGGVDNTIILWDVASGQALGQPLLGHTDRVNSLAFSPDGQILASGSGDRTIRFWDVATGQPQGVPFTGHPASVTTIAFSPDGQFLASGSEDDSVILWDVETRLQLGWPLIAHANSVLGIAFSPDGKILASASSDSNIALWDVTAGQFFVGHTSVIRSVAFSPDGTKIASGSFDKTVRLWDVASRRQIGPSLTGHTDEVWGIDFSPDGRTLASASYDGVIRLWDVSTGQLRSELVGQQGRAAWVDFSPDNQHVAGAYENGHILIWNVQMGQPELTLEGHTGFVNQIDFSPDGKLLASAGNDGQVILWDTAAGRPIGQPLLGHGDFVNGVDFSPDGRLLASGSDDKLVMLWDVATGKAVARLQGHANRVVSVAFSPDGKILASGGYDRNTILWDVATAQPISPPLIGHTNDVNSIAWHPNGQSLVSGSWDDTMILWRVDLRPWPERACRIANRNLEDPEIEAFVGDNYVYQPLCP